MGSGAPWLLGMTTISLGRRGLERARGEGKGPAVRLSPAPTWGGGGRCLSDPRRERAILSSGRHPRRRTPRDLEGRGITVQDTGIFGHSRHIPARSNLIDDAAVVSVPQGHDLVLKTDAIIGGVHSFPDDPRTQWRGRRSGSISPISPRRATPPFGFLLWLALPADIGD